MVGDDLAQDGEAEVVVGAQDFLLVAPGLELDQGGTRITLIEVRPLRCIARDTQPRSLADLFKDIDLTGLQSRHLRAGLQGLDVLDTCVAASELLVDDGVMTPEGFLDLGHLELGDVGPIPCDPVLSGKVAAVLACRLVTAATVSSAAGVDTLSQAYGLRSGAQIESLEGAAAAAVCRRFEVPFAELRVVSNRTGDRDKGGWDLDGALARLADATARLLDAGVLP